MSEKIIYILAEMEDFWSSRLPLALAAKEKGLAVHVASPGAAQDDKLKKHGFTGHDLPPAQTGLSFSAVTTNIGAIKKLLHEQNPKIAHIFTLKYCFLAGLAARRHKTTRLVYTIAGLGYLFSAEDFRPALKLWLLSPFLKIALRHPSARVIFQNPDDQSILIRRKFVRPTRTSLVLGSGVDLEKFKPAPRREDEVPLIVMPTRLVHDKGISVFIEMARLLQNRGVNARFQIAGGVTEHNPLAITKPEMEEMVAGSHVEWLGKISDMPALYASATLIVYPSWYREGIPRVLLEAAAAGRAAITTDHPGCRDAVAHEKTGLLVPVKNAAAMADAVQFLLDHPAARETMEMAARQRAETEFDINLITKQIMAIYEL